MSDQLELVRDLPEEYRLRFGGLSEYRQRVWRILIDDYFSRYVGAQDTVLDMACGWGEFINQVPARKRYAMDLNPDAVSRLDAGVELIANDAASPWPLAEKSLDCVFTSNFLEHLPDKGAVMRALGEAFRCLKPGGRLVCLGPNIRAIHGRYWDFFDHHTALSDLSLREAMELRGFDVGTCIGRFLPYTMSEKRQPPTWTLRLYLRMPWVWPLFGGQFLVVGTRPD